MAEHAGAALVGQVADRPTSVALDCKAVVCQTRRPIWKLFMGSNKFVGVRRFAHELEARNFCRPSTLKLIESCLPSRSWKVMILGLVLRIMP
eukprot:6025696-Pyramimonas_sp.AAC.1